MDRKGREDGSDDLSVCPSCESRLVQLPGCETTGWSEWRLWRRCPECGWQGDGVYGSRQCVAFDRALATGFKSLIRAAKVLERESMCDFVEIFAEALRADAITADDFAHRS